MVLTPPPGCSAAGSDADAAPALLVLPGPAVRMGASGGGAAAAPRLAGEAAGRGAAGDAPAGGVAAGAALAAAAAGAADLAFWASCEAWGAWGEVPARWRPGTCGELGPWQPQEPP
jgi:hypothetical protein